MRYNNIKTTNKKGKGLVYNSIVLPHVNPIDSDILIITSAEDRLDLLANHFYNDASLWWTIAVANNLTDIDLKLQPGIQLRIPTNVSAIKNLIK
jgi:hypothetical protein